MAVSHQEQEAPTEAQPAGAASTAPAPEAHAPPRDDVRDGARPRLSDVSFKQLYDKELYEAVTADGWTLVVTRYKPAPQPWHQPLLNVPILLVHGFSQNRHCFTAGDFAKHLLYLGLDVHILELRGHGKSSRGLQLDKQQRGERPLPTDWRWHWDVSDYMLYDVPAAIDAVKARTGWDKIAYCGHSMGGILGYAAAARRDDILCLTTVGSPVELGHESWILRAASRFENLIPPAQGAVRLFERGRKAFRRFGNAVTRREPSPLARPRSLSADVVPLDALLGGLYRSMAFANERTPHLLPKALRLSNPRHSRPEDVDWLLEFGEEKEPVAVLRTFMRWIRNRELVCYRTGFDILANLPKITVPTVIVYGDHDVLAGEASTRPAFERISSDYKVRVALEGNAHVDITMGRDTGKAIHEMRRALEHACRP